MNSKGKPLFDLNEPATEEDEEGDEVFCFQPQRAVPSTTHTSDLFTTSSSPRRIVNNHAFTHASSVSGFQPFIRSKGIQTSEIDDHKKEIDIGPAIEKEEGEWSDEEDSNMPEKSTSANDDKSEIKPVVVLMDERGSSQTEVVNTYDVKDEISNHGSLGVDGDSIDRKISDSQEDFMMALKQRDIKGIEAILAIKIANNIGKRPKIDHQKEAMLGKKRSRQTIFLNFEDVKQAGTIKTATPRRQNFPPPATTRIVKDKQIQQLITKDESNSFKDSSEPKPECSNGEMNSGILVRPKRSISVTDLATEDKLVSNHRQGVLKQAKNAQVLGTKTGQLVSQNSIDVKSGGKKLSSKKPLTATTQYQDSSVEVWNDFFVR